MKRPATLFLILSLALGSAYQAVLHLAHGTETLVELCIDGQAQRVAIGPDGRPAPHGDHDCADCIIASGVTLAGPAGTKAHAPIGRVLAFLPRQTPAQRGATLAAAPARAPPVSV